MAAAGGAAAGAEQTASYVELSAEAIGEWLVTDSLTRKAVAERLLGATTAADLTTTEVGDGNLNNVFIVRGPRGSVCVKQSLPYVKVVPSWSLSLHRIHFEAQALQLQQEWADGLVPKLYLFHPTMFVLIMEDLSDHVVLRGALVNGAIFPHLADNVSTFLANTLFFSSDLYMDGPQKRQLIATISANHPMSELTEEVVFTCPYLEVPSFTNTHTSHPALDAACATLIGDPHVKAAVAKLKAAFFSSTQALLHGDIHTGSLMVTPASTRAIDSEFVMCGPMSFDLGNVLAHLFIAYFAAIQRAADSSEPAKWHTQTQWLQQAITNTWTMWVDKFLAHWAKHTGHGLMKDPGLAAGTPAGDAYRAQFIASVFQESLGMMALEIIRRIVGVAHVADFSSIEDDAQRAIAEIAALNFAYTALLNAQHFDSIHRVMGLADHCAHSRFEGLHRHVSVVLVVKYPRPGICKTRLGAVIGMEAAADFAAASIFDLMTRLHSLPVPSDMRLHLHVMYGPASGQVEFEELMRANLSAEAAAAWSCLPWPNVPTGSPSNLGVRLQHGLAAAVHAHWGPVMFLGMDCLTLTDDELIAGFTHGWFGSAHLSPAHDGGYVMLTVPATAVDRGVFDDIPWSTSHTATAQLARCQAVGVPIRIGASFRDVDEPEDLEWLRKHAHADPSFVRPLCAKCKSHLLSSPGGIVPSSREVCCPRCHQLMTQ